ncbi:MAG TPA: hypothetical protein VNB22_22540 [Pyrinomonadaceae bacterium]|jgi:hypothetical protein|nr:hypothetical protein [Pyrinomonadaceae bacterium]
MKKILSKIALGLLMIGVLLGGWIAFDLLAPHKVDIRDFDADEVARLDTAMWRSYYSRERLKLYSELTELLEKQYKLNFWRRQLIAYRAAKATFVFKDGKSRTDYEKALPDLEKFYASIRDISTTDFDVNRAAKLELEWWIIHRERQKYQEGDLANALAETASAIYNLPKEVFIEHGRLRAEAMNIRDNKAEAGGVTEEDWQKIDELLHQSWRSLHNAVNNK